MRGIGLAASHTNAAPAPKGHVGEPVARDLCLARDIDLWKLACALILDSFSVNVKAEVIRNIRSTRSA